MKKLYYCEDEGNFYDVKQTAKTITINWVVHENCDGSELDQQVRWKNLKIINGKQHPVKQNDEYGLLVYPFQSGQPFFLSPATEADIDGEIEDCKEWGVGFNYYEELKKEL